MVPGYRDAGQKMPRTVRLDHDIAEPGCYIAGQENIVGNGERRKRKFRVELGCCVLLIGPFQKAVVDVVSGDCAACVRPSDDQTRAADTIVDRVTLEKVVA